MFPIVNRQILGKEIKRLDVCAKIIAESVLPGQFVMVIPEQGGEWIPLSVVENDPRRGTVALVFQENGETTRRLGAMAIGDSLFGMIGPLGKPADVAEDIGTVVCVGEGTGIASMLPIGRAFRKSGNKVIGIITAGTKKSLMLEMPMRVVCNKLYIATQDGTHVRWGDALGCLKEVLAQEKVQLVYAAGPVDMLEAVSRFTRQKKIRTLIFVESLISCGTGRCGSCRTKVGDQVLSVCLHGPELDAHQVDFEVLRMRVKAAEKRRVSQERSWFAGLSAGFGQKGTQETDVVKKFFPGSLGEAR